MSFSRHLTASCIACILLLFQLFLPPNAHAGGVVVCDNCANPRQAAIGSGSGMTIVVDFAHLKLYGFEVEYDREFKRYRAITTSIPAPVTDAFHRIMALAEGRIQPSSHALKRAGGSGAVVPIHPDNPGVTNGLTFPEGFKGINAYDVVMSATTRTQFEQQLGAAFSGASTGSPVWNSLATTLSSLGLSMISRLFGVDSATYVITWRGGSKSVFVIEADSQSTSQGRAATPQATEYSTPLRHMRSPVQTSADGTISLMSNHCRTGWTQPACMAYLSTLGMASPIKSYADGTEKL